jgi:hypothetical protein
MVGRVVGTLQVTDPCKCLKGICKPCGNAEQGPATANLSIGDTSVLSLNVQPSAASCGQALSINFREGPIETAAVVGSYRLNGAFRIGVSQSKGVFNRQAAVADFDPAPQLDAFWPDVLKLFRAVPRRDFGYKLILRVVEEAGAVKGEKAN